MLFYIPREYALTPYSISLSVNEDSATYLTGLLRSKTVARQCLPTLGLSGVMVVLLIKNTEASWARNQIQIHAACKRHKEKPFHLGRPPPHWFWRWKVKKQAQGTPGTADWSQSAGTDHRSQCCIPLGIQVCWRQGITSHLQWHQLQTDSLWWLLLVTWVRTVCHLHLSVREHFDQQSA